MTWSRMAVVGLMTLALASAGCGGGGSKAPSKADFIKQGDALCSRFRTELSAYGTKLSAAKSSAERSTLLNQLAATLDRQVAEFDALRTPEGDDAVIRRYLGGVRRETSAVRAAASALGKGDTAQGQALLQNMISSAASARGIAADYGFKVCGSD